MLVGIPALATHPWALTPEDLEVYDLPQAVPAARVEQLQEQTDRVASWRYDLQSYLVTEEQETHWRQTHWATAILEPLRQDVVDAIVRCRDRRRPISGRLVSSIAETVRG